MYIFDVHHQKGNQREYTVQGFWECACDKDFIHRTKIEPTCPVCGSVHDDCPDAMLEDLADWDKLTYTELSDLTTLAVSELKKGYLSVGLGRTLVRKVYMDMFYPDYRDTMMERWLERE